MISTSVAVAALAILVLAYLFAPSFFSRPLEPRRRWLIFFLQLIPLLLICWLLGNPFLIGRTSERTTPATVFLIDDSPSMAYEDGLSGEPRIEAVEDYIQEIESWWEENRRSAPLSIVRLGDVTPPGRTASDFASALEEVNRRFSEDTLEAVVLVSDGRDRSRHSLRDSVARLRFPVHTIGIGPDVEPDQVAARWLEAPERADPGSPILAKWAIESRLTRPRPVDVIISFASEEVQAQELILESEVPYLDGWISITPTEPGRFNLQLRVQDKENEETVALSESEILVEEHPITILVFESRPSRTMQSYCQSVLQSGRYRVLRPIPTPGGGGVVSELFRPRSAFPEEAGEPWSKERIVRYESEDWPGALETLLRDTTVIVLGRGPWEDFPERWPNDLQNWLGANRLGLLAAPGSGEGLQRLPEGSLLSVVSRMENRTQSRYPLQVRAPEKARTHPALAPVWAYLGHSWEIGADDYFPETPSVSEVLLADQRDHAVVYTVGFELGRAVLCSLSNLWRLRAFSNPESSRNEAQFVEGLWVGITDFLSRSARPGKASISLEPPAPTVGQSVRIQVRDSSFSSGPLVSGLRIRRGSETWSELLLAPDPDWRGIGEAVWTPRETGSYEILFASEETSLSVQVADRPPETGDITLDEPVLQSLATSTGGVYFHFQDRENLLPRLNPQIQSITRTTRRPYRHHGLVGTALALLFCAGWGLRRLWSLP